MNIVFRSPKASAARECADNLAQSLRRVCRNTQIYGPNECPIEKIRENYRIQIILRSKKASDMLSGLNSVVSSIKLPHNVAMDIDVDPVDLL